MIRLRQVFRAILVIALFAAGCATAPVPSTRYPAPPTGQSKPATPVAAAAYPSPARSPRAAAAGTPTATVPSQPTASVAGSTTTTPVSSTSPVSGFPVTVTDDAGNTVTFQKDPLRIISLSPGHTETLYALGLGDKIIMSDQYSTYPPENKPKAKLNTYPKPNEEQIVSLQPDLIVTLVEGEDFNRAMAARGIKVLTLFPKDFDGTLKDINLLGRVTGTEAKAQQITSQMRQRANVVEAKTKPAPKIKVLYELDASDPSKPWVAGPTGFFGSLVPLAGGKNVFADLTTTASQVSAEQIISRDPDVIILADANSPYNAQTPAMVKLRPGWSQITAVRDNRIEVIDSDLLSRPGPRLIDGLEQMAKLIHPELFK